MMQADDDSTHTEKLLALRAHESLLSVRGCVTESANASQGTLRPRARLGLGWLGLGAAAK